MYRAFMATLIPKQSASDVPESLDDACFAMQEMLRNAFDDIPGDFVAVYQKKVVGSGDDETALRQRLSEEYRVDPERFFVAYKGE
jgi:hypothetical protein